ncbi:sporulation-specific protein 15-like [Asparagus officinalis]|nr:sporulation-specific protein 15-like [Asparagus officinalis]XP_020248020.1 sporulation-specific protein 15-like [Asparagus officinalis]
MKKKHRLEKIFQSVFGNHSDAENSEALPNREETDKNVERILKMLRTEGSDVDKSELASLIDNIHRGYQVVHGRYDHLMGKLKKNIRPKSSDNGSFSIDFPSSDSEDSDSSSEDDKKKKRNKVQEDDAEHISIQDHQSLQRQLEDMKIKNNELETVASAMSAKLKEEQSLAAEMAESVKTLQAENDGLRKELDVSLKKEEDVNQKIQALYKENESLRSENAEALNKIHEAGKSIEKFQIELNQIENDMKRYKSENSILKEELERTSEEAANLNKRLISVSEEKESLRSGNFVFLKRIKESEKALAALKDQADQKLKLVTEELTSEKTTLSTENESLKLRLEAAAQQEANMTQKISAAEEEISVLKSEIQRSSTLIQEAEKTIGDLETESKRLRDENLKLLNVNNDLNHQLDVKTVENEAMKTERLEAVEVIRQAEEKISMLSVQIETLKDESSKLLVDNGTLKQELEATNGKVSALMQTLESTEDEKHSLAMEKSALIDKIHQAEQVIDDLKAETEQQESEKSQLHIKINDLARELEAANSKLSDLNKELNAKEEEKSALALEISGLMITLQERDSNKKGLENELEHLREENYILQQNQMKIQEAEKTIDDLKAEVKQLTTDNSQLKANVNDLGRELEASNLQLTDTNKTLVAAEEEKKILASEASTVTENLQQAEVKVGKLGNDVVQMTEEISVLLSKLLEAERTISEHKDEIKQLRDDKSQLEKKISELGLELEAANLQLVDLKKVTEATEEEKISLTSEIETIKGELQQGQHNLQTLEGELGKLQEENVVLEQNQSELQRQKIYLEEKLREKEKEKCNMEESYKELLAKLEVAEGDKADEDREIAKLNQKVQNLEVQLRLSNQKLKITETESKETVEGYIRTMEGMKAERQAVEEQMLKLSRKMNLLGTEVKQLKEVAESGISDLAKGYNELESAFEESSGHILKQLSICSEELNALKKWVTELKYEKQELSVRLKYKEGIMSMMKDESESIGDKLSKKEQELAVLRAHAIKCEERMKVLEEMLREKKKEVSDKDEAKREAIRQLCLLIEYHRENSENLYKHLSSVLKRSRRSS